jgi:hypothetical protein
MTELPKRPIGWRTVALVLVALLVMAVFATRRNRTLGLGQTIQYDDFFFTVEQVDRLSGSRGSASSPGLDDFLVRLRIDNRAKRVPYQFRGDSLVFVDISRNEAGIRPVAERLPSGENSAPRTHELKAGESITADYLFRLPPDLNRFRLRVSSSGPIGDLLEWLVFGRQEFRLP